MERREVLRLGVFVLFLLFALVVYVQYDVHELRVGELQEWVAGYGLWGPLVYVLFYAVAPLVFVPGSILTIAAGVLFGKGLGFVYAVVGANLSAGVSFVIVRYFGAGVQRLGHGVGRVRRFHRALERHGFLATLYLRMIPVFPLAVLNYGLPLTKVRWREYFFGTFLGMLPAIFVYAYLGEALFKPLSIDFWIAIVLFVLIALLPVAARRYWRIA